MPSSLQARMIRSAISPRLAIKTFSNMQKWRQLLACESTQTLAAASATFLTNSEKHLAELHRFTILSDDFGDDAAGFRLDLVHHFHCLDNANHCVLSNFCSNIDEGYRLG